MFNMYEMMRQAQGGAALDNLSRAYGLPPERMRAAIAALTPAFAQGFQRQAQSDDASRRLASLFDTETYARAFETQAAALDSNAKSAGDDALGVLFGSKEVSRAVAAQASAASGVQAEIIRRVLPVLASILMGGFVKAAQGARTPAQDAPGFGGPVGEFWAQALRTLSGSAGGAQKGAAPENPFQAWANAFTQSAPASREASQQGAQTPQNPLGEVMAGMLNAMFAGGAPAEPTAAEPSKTKRQSAAEKPEAEEAAGATPFDDMMATGREFSAQNAKAMEQIFDAFFSKKGGG
jgi:hypothetical protein